MVNNGSLAANWRLDTPQESRVKMHQVLLRTHFWLSPLGSAFFAAASGEVWGCQNFENSQQ
eukprot:1325075-Amphidinium_carterae.1